MNNFKKIESVEIPVDWQIKPLSEIATFTKKSRSLALSEHSLVPFIPMELIPDDGLEVRQFELKAGDDIRSGTTVQILC